MVTDEGESGKSLDRPGLKAALERIAQHGMDGLVAAKLDRISRSVRDLERAPIGALVGPSARRHALSRCHQETRGCALLAGENTDRLGDR